MTGKKSGDAQKLRKAKRALVLADSIMNYCQGDKWERECTAKDREKFNKLFNEVMGKENNS